MGNFSDYLESATIESKKGWGIPQMYPHKNANSKGDESMTLTVRITEIKMSNAALKNHLVMLNTRIDSLLRVENNSLLQLTNKVNEINNKLQRLDALEAKVDALAGPKTTPVAVKVEKPQCPYCFEDFTSSSKIAQCISGHLVCWTCNNQNNNRNCGLCGEPINGRAFGMENYLRSIFG
eukprot:TRINITY_DN27290_c0_g1_i1.p1 TRINITY_DN27290_c0_g1~~TRINITY_DN27290_c0_g1_i1.p1  ORF type:complete len:204 (+),score=27.60 TRINITY_DN27290_c0_g1_i1:77-613(+)